MHVYITVNKRFDGQIRVVYNGNELVDFCTVSNAKTNENKRTVARGNREETIIETSVTAQVVAYLKPDEGVDRR